MRKPNNLFQKYDNTFEAPEIGEVRLYFNFNDSLVTVLLP